jgi:AcrR family transcriptional regulator
VTTPSRSVPRGRRPGPTETREDILDAARDLFSQQGYEKASMRAIARRAKVDPALIVHYFSSKEGLLVQLANPKAAVFMLAFYPQFVPAQAPLFATTAALALLQVAIETVLYLGLAAGVARTGAWFRRPVVRRRMEALSGGVLIALGARVAVDA